MLLAGDINDNSPNPQTISLGLVFNGGTSNVNVAPGGALALGTLTFGAAPQATTFSTLNVNNSVAAGPLVVQTNTAPANSINIAAGAGFNVASERGTNAILVVGTPPTSTGATTTSLTVTGGGTFNVGGSDANFIVGVGSGNNAFGDSNATLDLSGLANFVYNGTRQRQLLRRLRHPDGRHAPSGQLEQRHHRPRHDCRQTARRRRASPTSEPTTTPPAAASNLFLGSRHEHLQLGWYAQSRQYQGSRQHPVRDLSRLARDQRPRSRGQPVAGPQHHRQPRIAPGRCSGTSSILSGRSQCHDSGRQRSRSASRRDRPDRRRVCDVRHGHVQRPDSEPGRASPTAPARAIGTFVLGGPTPDTIATGVLNVSTASESSQPDRQRRLRPTPARLIINGGTANINANIVDASTQGNADAPRSRSPAGP